MSYTYPFRMASGASTMLPIDPVLRRVCLGVRSKSSWMYPGVLSLAGGFMEARYKSKGWRQSVARWTANQLLRIRQEGPLDHEGENLEEAAQRELWEELGIKTSLDQLHMFAVRSNSRTDTRAHVINACYWLEMTQEQVASAVAGDDLESLVWMDIEEAKAHTGSMAFNHLEIMLQGIAHWEEERRVRDMERELQDMRLAVWMVGNMDTEEDKAAWWKDFRSTWDEAAGKMTRELAQRVTDFDDQPGDLQ